MRVVATVVGFLFSSVCLLGQATFDPALFMAQDVSGKVGHYHKTGWRACPVQDDPRYVAVANDWCGGVPMGAWRHEGWSKSYRDGGDIIVTIKSPRGGPSERYRIVPDEYGNNTVRIVSEVLDWNLFDTFRTFSDPTTGEPPEFLGNGSQTEHREIRLVYRDCAVWPPVTGVYHDIAEYHETLGPFDVSTDAGRSEVSSAWLLWSDEPSGSVSVPATWTKSLKKKLGWKGPVWVVTLRSFWNEFDADIVARSAFPDASLAYRFEEQYDFLCVGATPFDCHGVGLVGWRVFYRASQSDPQRLITAGFLTRAVREASPVFAKELCTAEPPSDGHPK